MGIGLSRAEVIVLGTLMLEHRLQQIDKGTNWSFECLLSDIDAIEKKLSVAASDFLEPFAKTQPRQLTPSKDVHPSPRVFVAPVSDACSEDDGCVEHHRGRSTGSLMVIVIAVKMTITRSVTTLTSLLLT